MITKFRHTGIVVRKLQDQIDFYIGLGFDVFHREIEEGNFIAELVKIKDARLETAKLMSPCGDLLELLEYHSHPDSKMISLQKSNQLGCSHIAFTVDSLVQTLNQVEALGGNRSDHGLISPNGKHKVAYCHDPEGNLLELVEELKTK